VVVGVSWVEVWEAIGSSVLVEDGVGVCEGVRITGLFVIAQPGRTSSMSGIRNHKEGFIIISQKQCPAIRGAARPVRCHPRS